LQGKEGNYVKTVAYLLSGVVIFLLVGCASIGPGTVTRDRFDYLTALSDSWKSQMLINTVKLRYGDTPVFLDIASIISGYTLEGGASISGQFAPKERGDTFGAFGISGLFADRPTITYMPLSGERFTRSLLRPIPPPALLALIEAGYPIDLILRVCASSINGIRNRFGGAARARPADPAFYPLLERLRVLQSSGAIDLRVQKTGDAEGVVMIFRGKLDRALEEDSLFVRRTLGLGPTAREFKVVYGAIAKNDKEIAILSRSILEIIIDLASYIEVPAVHVEEKRVNPTMSEETVQGGAAVPPLIRIHSSPDKPGDAFVSVPYRNHWFWIDDRDLRSKSLFSFFMFLFSLTETGGKEGAPIITIPAG
jgi:hypothetical protein